MDRTIPKEPFFEMVADNNYPEQFVQVMQTLQLGKDERFNGYNYTVSEDGKALINGLPALKSTNRVHTSVIGSQSYRDMIYAGDLDFIQVSHTELNDKCGANLARVAPPRTQYAFRNTSAPYYYSKKFGDMLARILARADWIYGELKIGVDIIYHVNPATQMPFIATFSDYLDSLITGDQLIKMPYGYDFSENMRDIRLMDYLNMRDRYTALNIGLCENDIWYVPQSFISDVDDFKRRKLLPEDDYRTIIDLFNKDPAFNTYLHKQAVAIGGADPMVGRGKPIHGAPPIVNKYMFGAHRIMPTVRPVTTYSGFSYAHYLDSVKKTAVLHLDQLAYEQVYDIFRNLKVLRWSNNEVISGTKVNEDTQRKYNFLETLCAAEGDINVEAIGVVNGRYTDVSNYIVLYYVAMKSENPIDNRGARKLFTSFVDNNPHQLKNLEKYWHDVTNKKYTYYEEMPYFGNIMRVVTKEDKFEFPAWSLDYLFYMDDKEAQEGKLNRTRMRLGLKNAIYMSAYSKLFYNPVKLTKRYFSLSRILNDIQLRNKVSPLLTSKLGYYGATLGEFKLLHKIIAKYGRPPNVEIFKEQIQRAKFALNKLEFIPSTHLGILIDHINKLDEKPFNSDKYEKLLSSAINMIEPPIFGMFLEQLVKLELYPIPKKYDIKSEWELIVGSYEALCRYFTRESPTNFKDVPHMVGMMSHIIYFALAYNTYAPAFF